VTSPPFTYDLDEERGVLVLRGELDEPATAELRETIRKATDQLTSDLAIDLAGVTLLPSPAIGVLASSKADARSHGATLTLVAPAGSFLARLLTICALDHVDALG
jgi:anti-anti-sigma factor